MIVAHIMGIPVEESVVQLVPVGATVVTAVAVFGRTLVERLQRRHRNNFERRRPTC